jgi:hypothetical protein
VALVALGETISRLKSLLVAALEQSASVVLVSDLDKLELPPEVEIQPASGLKEVKRWADYVAVDLPREKISGLREMLGGNGQTKVSVDAQVLVLTPMPCG